MNAARTSRRWMAICRGDPVLRVRVRSQLKKLVEWRRQALLDPRMAVTVHRMQEKRLFHTNVEKVVTRNMEFERQRELYQRTQPVARVFSIEDKYAGRSGAGKEKRLRNKYKKPYRSMRL